jgi:NAD(P)-dependent dehydrogenase (short-subunit alcohol dehydrogenase family)
MIGVEVDEGAEMNRLCEGRVVIVTGAGRGIGREYALMLASHGAKVIVNDLGGARDGTGSDDSPADQVVAEIVAAGGEAAANGENVADFAGAQRMIEQAVATFGDLHAVVNNAGILRDRMLANMEEAEWDAVINVHLKGTFAPARHAAAYWRERSKAGAEVSGRIINTTSVSGIYGNIGQTNYGAAKAGIAAFTNIAALELARYGVTVNAIAPAALTRMTEDLGMGQASDEDKAAMDPKWIAPIVTWLVSEESAAVSGRIFEASGRVLAVAEGWVRGPDVVPTDDPTAMGPLVESMLATARANSGMNGEPGGPPQSPTAPNSTGGR